MPKGTSTVYSSALRISQCLPSQRIALLLVLAAALLPYWGTLGAPFVFDDVASIVNNESLRNLGSWHVLLPGDLKGAGVHGRPLVNVTLALNYALSGLHPWSYHLFNSMLHAGSALLLFGLLRRTFCLPALREKMSEKADSLALSISVLWAAHPLLTETVTCVIQRTEGLVSFFILLALYCFVRAQNSTRPNRWLLGTVTACIIGMLSKELMAVLPIFILLFDRQLLSEGFVAAIRRRQAFYAALLISYSGLILSLLLAPMRGGSVGFGLGMSSWHYALTQCDAIVRYLGLCFWPSPLVLDYGASLVPGASAVIPQGILVLALLAATIWSLCMRKAAGLSGAWFFGILAPSSSFIPLTTQTLAEHRMYLPSIAVLLCAVLLFDRVLKKWTLLASVLLTSVLGVFTVLRNEDYSSALRIWNDTATKCPDNPRAQFNLANALLAEKRPLEAIPHYRCAVDQYRKAPAGGDALATASYNLGLAYLYSGDSEHALGAFSETLSLKPDSVDAWINLAAAQSKLGQSDDAIRSLKKALGLSPGAADAHLKVADLLSERGLFTEAISHYEASLGTKPDQAAAHAGLAGVLLTTHKANLALRHLEEAERLDPGNPSIQTNRVLALLILGREGEAETLLNEIMKQTPGYAPARNLQEQLAAAKAASGRH
jgi:Flp pilus assembly protein TadD